MGGGGGGGGAKLGKSSLLTQDINFLKNWPKIWLMTKRVLTNVSNENTLTAGTPKSLAYTRQASLTFCTFS